MVSEMFAGAAECPQQPCCRFPKTRFVRYRRCSPPRIGCTTPSPKRSIVGSFASEICVPVGEVVQVIGETRHGEGSGLNVVYTLDPHQMGVEFIGEINERSKTEFLSEAQALLFPIDWPEPFGLVMIEAMACGTPVLAFRHGPVSEIIDQGVTGAIVDTMDEAVRMLPQVLALDRHAVRRRFEQRFSSARMATDYVALYRSLLQRPSISEREATVPLPRPVLEKS
jgi:glycosyl transferase family 1